MERYSIGQVFHLLAIVPRRSAGRGVDILLFLFLLLLICSVFSPALGSRLLLLLLPDQLPNNRQRMDHLISRMSRHCSGPTAGLTKMQNDFLMEGGSQAALPSSSWVCPRRPVLPSSPSSSAAPASLLALRPCLHPSASSPGSADKGQQQSGLGHATNNYCCSVRQTQGLNILRAPSCFGARGSKPSRLARSTA